MRVDACQGTSLPPEGLLSVISRGRDHEWADHRGQREGRAATLAPQSEGQQSQARKRPGSPS
jgi:hypothetical protein